MTNWTLISFEEIDQNIRFDHTPLALNVLSDMLYPLDYSFWFRLFPLPLFIGIANERWTTTCVTTPRVSIL